MHLSPEVLRESYNYLKVTPPFRRWKLPDADEISWIVSNTKRVFGECHSVKWKDNRLRKNYHILVSCSLVKTTDQLMQTMAHEMCHIRCEELGVKATHGYEFKRIAKSVCREHGWREELF